MGVFSHEPPPPLSPIWHGSCRHQYTDSDVIRLARCAGKARALYATLTHTYTPLRALYATRTHTYTHTGVESVAIYHPDDAGALHPTVATEAIELTAPGGDSPVVAYLDIEQIVAAAVLTGCDCVHP